MPEIALTGSSGHLGFVIHRMLKHDGIPHRLMLRKEFDYLDHADVVLGALEDDRARAGLVEGCRTIIHCAGVVWPKTGPNASVLRVNYEMTRLLYEDSVRAGVEHFIFISSIHSMIVPGEDDVFDETASLVTSTGKSYDFSKAETERYLGDRTEMRITILNPTAIIGPGDHYIRGLNQLFDRLNRNRLPAVTSGGFDVVDVRDVAGAAIASYRLKREGKFLVSGKYYPMSELTELFGVTCGKKVTGRVIGPRMMRFLAAVSMPVDRLTRKPLPLNTYSVNTLLEGHSGISSRKAAMDLQYTSRPVEETLSDLVVWLNDKELIL